MLRGDVGAAAGSPPGCGDDGRVGVAEGGGGDGGT
jgi:hypothetical protein